MNSTRYKFAGSATLAFLFLASNALTHAQVPSAKSTQKTPDDAQADKRAAEAIQLLFTPGPLIKNRPFSAEAVTETVQTIGDGNRIVRRNLTKEYRDRDGRIRQEQTLEFSGQTGPHHTRTLISIHDPVAHFDYVIDPETRTASIVDPSNPFISAPRILPTSSGKGITQNLGSRTIEGLLCTGTRSTITIPAGQLGNERPIASITETWYSSDLEAVVRSTASDPRFGKTSYVLRNIRRDDQPPSLFQPPSDYQVRRQSNPSAGSKPLERP